MTAIGALVGLLISVFLIIKKTYLTYSLIAGAIVGGLLGGLSLADTVSVMTDGVKDVTPAIIRILTAGVLSGVLIKTGAATTISNAIINTLGEKRVFAALALAVLIEVIDVRKKKEWCTFFKVFGVNPLLLYVATKIFGDLFRTWHINTFLFDTCLQPLFGNYFGSFMYAALFLSLIWLVGYILFKKQIYIKL